MWYRCRVCGFQQQYMLQPRLCRACGREGTMVEGAKKSGYSFYDISERFVPIELEIDDPPEIDVDDVEQEGKPVSLTQLDFQSSGKSGEKYVQLLRTRTTYVRSFNTFMLPEPDTFAWLVPYTGNHHNRTVFTHLVISAVARQVATKFRRLPTLIEPFAGTGQIFLNSVRTVGLFNGGYPLFCRMIGGDLNHYLIASYSVMSTDAKFVDKYVLFAEGLDENPEESFFDAKEWLAQQGKESALGQDPTARLGAVFRYIYLVNRCLRGSTLAKNGGLSVSPNPKVNLVNVRKRERETLTNVVALLARFPCTLRYCDFELTCASAQPGDLVVMDCPFPAFTYFDQQSTVNSSTYGTGNSGDGLQDRITKVARQLAASGVTVLLCNYANPSLLRDYSGIGARVIFTYKRPTTKSEVYQLAILPGLINGMPIVMDGALERIRSTWSEVSGDELVTAPQFSLFEDSLKGFFGLFKKLVLFSKRAPGKRDDLPGVTQGTVSQFWVPGGEVACSPMATLAISYLIGLGSSRPVTADGIDNLLLEGTLLYKRMASGARDEQDLMRALAMSMGQDLGPGVAPGDAPYFNPVDIPEDALAERRLTITQTFTLNHSEVAEQLRLGIPLQGQSFGLAIVMGGYTISITRVGRRVFLFDSHGWEGVENAFVHECDIDELDKILSKLDQMLVARVSRQERVGSFSFKSKLQDEKNVSITVFKPM